MTCSHLAICNEAFKKTGGCPGKGQGKDGGETRLC